MALQSEDQSVQFSCSVVSDSETPWITARQASLSITNSRSSLRLTSIESVMPSSHLILCRPLLLLPPIHPSIRVFSNESTLRMRWPKYWSFSFSIIPSIQIPGLISFRMDWLDLLAVQGTLKSLLNMKIENYKKHSHKEKSVFLHCDNVICVSTTPGKYGYPINTGWITNFNCHLKDKYCMVAILCGTKKKKKANSQNRT